MTLGEWIGMTRVIRKQSGSGEMTQARFDELLDDARARFDWIKR